MPTEAHFHDACPDEPEASIAEKRRSLVRRLLRRLQWCVRPLRRAGREITLFAHFAWPGAAVGSVAAAVVLMAYAAFFLRSGLGTAVDMIGCALGGALAVALVGLLIMLIVTILRAWPRLFTGAFLGAIVSCVLIFRNFGFSRDMILRIAMPIALISAIAAAGIAVLARRHSPRAKTSHLAAAVTIAILAAAAAVRIFVWLAGAGFDPYLITEYPVADANIPQIKATNPGESGPYKVAKLFYGSGVDKRRPEYGPQVTVKTDPVDASAFVKNLKGFRAKARKWYWGFGADQFPLNARVWFPEGQGPFPLVLIVHGNHQMEEFSDSGYEYLGELLASRGFITASVDENFLNGSWTGDIGGENGARGWILLQHLALWRAWSQTEGNPFYEKVDLSNIALIGHSRGGEAIAHAAAFNRLTHFPDDANIRFNFNFSIKSLVSIAGIDGQYEPANQPVPLENINYLVLQGSHDSDVDFFAGSRPYRRVKFTDEKYWIKSALYIYRANHGQFNTVWGRCDVGPLLGPFLNTAPLLQGDEQRRIAKTYISAFLEATLRGKREYVPMFRDHRVIGGWLPRTIYLSQFQDSTFRVVSNFDDTVDVTKTTIAGGMQAGENLTVWQQRELKGRDNWPFRNSAVVLGWDNANATGDNATNCKIASYALTLPDGKAREWQLAEKTLLVFSLADTDEDPRKPNEVKSVKAPDQKRCDDQKADTQEIPNKSGQDGQKKSSDKTKDEKKQPADLTVELVAADGATASVPLSRFLPIQPILKVKFTKWDYYERTRYKSPSEPVLQTYEIPISAFVSANPAFSPSALKVVRFRFDRTKAAVIVLDEVGFARSVEYQASRIEG